MSILHVVAGMDPGPGGVGDAVFSLASAMTEGGQPSEIVCLEKPGAEALQGASVPVTAAGPAIGPWSYSPKLMPWLRSNLGRFEAVIIHGLWLFHSYSVWRLLSDQQGKFPSRAKRIPWFVMPHGMLAPDLQDGGAVYGNLEATRNAAFWRAVERSVINEADGLLFTTVQEMSLARTTFPCYSPRSERVIGAGGDFALLVDTFR